MKILPCRHVLLCVGPGSPFAFRKLWVAWGLFSACTLLFQVSHSLLRLNCPLVSCLFVFWPGHLLVIQQAHKQRLTNQRQ